MSAPAGTRGRAPSPASAFVALLQADSSVQVRNGRAWLLSLALPLIVLYALFAGKRARTEALGAPTVRLAVAIMVGMSALAVLGYSLSVARDREKGVFQRLRVTPAPTWTIMGSRLVVQVGAILVMAVVVLVAGAVFENISLSIGGYVLTIAVAMLSSALYLSIGQAFAGLVTSADTINAMGRFVLIPLVGLGLLSHFNVFGQTFETVARWSPGGTVTTMLAAAMQPHTWTGETWWAIVAGCAYTVVCVWAGIRWFRWSIV